MKFVPNIFTLLNLVFGCLAIAAVFQNSMVVTAGPGGELLLMLPEKIYLASLFIALAAVIDFFDGLVARMCSVTSDLGKQLDSLADVVSFGVAPGFIIYQFLRLSYSQQPDGLDVSMLWLLPAFIVPCAGAFRLARFNVDTFQVYGFKGVPIPAAGLLIAAFPLIYWYSNTTWISGLLLTPWFWFALVIIVSYLMVSPLPMMALKFSSYKVSHNLPKIILVVIAIIAALLLKWLAVPVIFVAYVVISILTQEPLQKELAPES